MAVYYASKSYVLSLSLALSKKPPALGSPSHACAGPTRTGFQDRAQMNKSRLFRFAGVMRSADVARVGYDAMIAGKALAIPASRTRSSRRACGSSPGAWRLESPGR